jgi:hypothetical protein
MSLKKRGVRFLSYAYLEVSFGKLTNEGAMAVRPGRMSYLRTHFRAYRNKSQQYLDEVFASFEVPDWLSHILIGRP